MTCNKCQKHLTATVYLYHCSCLICDGKMILAQKVDSRHIGTASETTQARSKWCTLSNSFLSLSLNTFIECATTDSCPSCGTRVEGPHHVRELLITSASDKKPGGAATAAKTDSSQWLFVKERPSNEPLATRDILVRLLKQHQKQKDVTKVVLRQLARKTRFLQRECLKYRHGVASTRTQEVDLRQELHKRKEMLDIQSAKVKNLEQQLHEKDLQIRKFQKMYNESPSRFTSPVSRQPSRQGANPAEVSAEADAILERSV